MDKININYYDLLSKVRAEKPLIHHITNWVTINDCANMTRAFGALPVMSHAKEESSEMASLASALVLNIGTLDKAIIESMILAGKSANKKGIPVILDCVGVGATKFRDETAREILKKIRVDIIKGNSSEIARISGLDVKTKGVEASKIDEDLNKIAIIVSKNNNNSTVVITGKEDIVTDGKKLFIIKNGHEMMGSIVGTGCMATSVIASFCAIEKDYCIASVGALVSYEIAGELASKKSRGPGSFKVNLFDEVSNLNEIKIKGMAKVEQHII
jgi:hydroxyethylthiazole kinase